VCVIVRLNSGCVPFYHARQKEMSVYPQGEQRRKNFKN
jgi:hypothetical protein